jgi:hypothetical protein
VFFHKLALAKKREVMDTEQQECTEEYTTAFEEAPSQADLKPK